MENIANVQFLLLLEAKYDKMMKNNDLEIHPYMKKLLWRLCCLFLVLSLLPVGILAADNPPVGAGKRKLEGGQRDFRWPVPGAYNMSSCFLDKREHYSLDIAAPRGTKVVASYKATVIEIYTSCEDNWGKDYTCCTGWGNFVLLKHSYTLKNGEKVTMYSRYAHLTDVSVSVGQTVEAGQKIGTVGSTGRSSGPHLDYEILYGGTSPSKTYSLDPYVNDLLELPEELHTTFGKCCQDYVAYVKQLYPRCRHESYDAKGNCTDCGYEFNWKSTWDCDAMGNYTANTQTRISAVPYQPEGEGIGVLEAGAAASVQATVINGAGATWYEISLADGAKGYVPEDKLTFESYFASEIKGALSTLEEGQVLPQESHRIDGRITSSYPLRRVNAYLNGALYATWTGKGGTRQLDLRGTAVNKKLSIAQLAPGEYTLTVTVEDSTGREEVQVISCTFTVEAAPTEPIPTEPETLPEATTPTITQPPTTAPTETQTEALPPATTAPVMPIPDTQEEAPPINLTWLYWATPLLLLAGGLAVIWLKKRKEAGIFIK